MSKKKKKRSAKRSSHSGKGKSVPFSPKPSNSVVKAEDKANEAQTPCPESEKPPKRNKYEERKKAKREAEEKRLREEKKRRIIRRVCIPAAALLVLLAVALPVAVYAESDGKTVEIGERADLSFLERGLTGILCSSHDGEETIDTSSLGKREVRAKLLGFLPFTAELAVVDTCPPTVTFCDVAVGQGVAVSPDDFVLSSDDKTAVTYAFDGDVTTDALGDKSVTVTATDEGGNTVSGKVTLTVDGDGVVAVELGTAEDAVKTELLARFPSLTAEETLAVDSVGEKRIRLREEDGVRVLLLNVQDTIAPTANVRNRDFTTRDTPLAEDFLENLTDASALTLEMTADDLSSVGEHTVTVTATDACGNTADFTAHAVIHDIPDEIKIEAGIDGEALLALLAPNDGNLSVPEEFEAHVFSLGEQEIELLGKYDTLSVKVRASDHEPPTLSVKTAIAFVGQTVTPEMFVSSCTDGTHVTLRLEDEVRTDKPQWMRVTVIATDEAGNETRAQSAVTVLEDREAPAIYGVSTLYAGIGESVEYLSGVYAIDNADGTVEVTVDASTVDTSKEGTYPVLYVACDRSGNRALLSSSVVVASISEETVGELAEKVLGAILSDGMTERERARAIYDWATASIRYSTRTSYLMGHFTDAAYSGFVTRAGNCYIYYAISSVLLTRAGIENLEVHRNSESNPHYWNLVKIDGDWYHFDTCPHYKEYPIESFLLTDAEMKEYSETQSVGYYDFDSSLYPATP